MKPVYQHELQPTPEVRKAAPVVSGDFSKQKATAQAMLRLLPPSIGLQDAWHEPRVTGGVWYDSQTDTYNWTSPGGQPRSKSTSWFLDKFGAYLDWHTACRHSLGIPYGLPEQIVRPLSQRKTIG